MKIYRRQGLKSRYQSVMDHNWLGSGEPDIQKLVVVNSKIPLVDDADGGRERCRWACFWSRFNMFTSTRQYQSGSCDIKYLARAGVHLAHTRFLDENISGSGCAYGQGPIATFFVNPHFDQYLQSRVKCKQILRHGKGYTCIDKFLVELSNGCITHDTKRGPENPGLFTTSDKLWSQSAEIAFGLSNSCWTTAAYSSGMEITFSVLVSQLPQ